jgi:hypothetical protein
MSDIPVKVQRENTCCDLRPPLTTDAAATYHAASETRAVSDGKKHEPAYDDAIDI